MTSPSWRETPGTVLGEHPLAAAVAAVALVGVVRALEVLAGVHSGVGALAVSTTLALVVALVLSRTGAPVRDRPRRPRYLRRALLVGGVGVVGVQAVAHALAVGWLTAIGEEPTVLVTAVNPATKSSAAGQVGAYLLFGVVLAAVGEELLFRGVLLDALARRFSFWPANATQGALFGAWHLVWPLAVVLADATAVVSLPVYAAGFVVVTGTVGAVYGVFARATGTVWTPVLAHLLHNLAAVVLHVRAAGGTDRGSVVSAVLVAGYAALAWGAWARWEQ